MPKTSTQRYRPRPPLSSIPPQAAAVGYSRKTFTSDFKNNWYLWSFFGGHASPTNVVFNSDGSVTLQGDTTGPNGQIATGHVTSGGFVGTSFAGGAYFEATFKFYPQTVIDRDFNGWPSFWSMAREHLAQEAAQQWPGQAPGYDHFIEADFFEYDTYPYNHWMNGFGSCLHDYSGIYPNYVNNFSDPTAVGPANIDFRQYHKF